jgi:hypothetical protein
MKQNGASDREIMATSSVVHCLDGTKAVKKADMDHNLKKMHGLNNFESLARVHGTLSDNADNNDGKTLENALADNHVVMWEESIIPGEISKRIVMSVNMGQETSYSVHAIARRARMIALGLGYIVLGIKSDCATWNVKALKSNMTYPSETTGIGLDVLLPGECNIKVSSDCLIYKAPGSNFRPLYHYLPDFAHAVIKSTSNQIYNKKEFMMYNPILKKYVPIDMQLIRKYADQYDLYQGIRRIEPGVSLGKIYGRCDNNSLKMNVANAAANSSAKLARFSKKQIIWQQNEIKNNTKLTADYIQKSNKVINGLQALEKHNEIKNRIIDVGNGHDIVRENKCVSKGGHIKKYCNHYDTDIIIQLREYPRYLKNELNELEKLGFTAVRNFYSHVTINNVTQCLFGKASFLIHFSHLFNGSKTCSSITNGDIVESGFAVTKQMIYPSPCTIKNIMVAENKMCQKNYEFYRSISDGRFQNVKINDKKKKYTVLHCKGNNTNDNISDNFVINIAQKNMKKKVLQTPQDKLVLSIMN